MGFETIFLCCFGMNQWLYNLVPIIRDFLTAFPKQNLAMKTLSITDCYAHGF
jgi:hypothetical protein